MRQCKDEGHEFLCRLGAGSCFRQGPSSCNADEPPERDDLSLLRAVLSDADMQIIDDGQDVRVTFHAKGDGFTPYAAYVSRREAERLRQMLGAGQ